MKVDWYQLYMNRVNEAYREYFRRYYRVYVREMCDAITIVAQEQTMLETIKVAEFGCGAGTATRVIHDTMCHNDLSYQYIHLKYYMYDKDSRMLKLAQNNTKFLGRKCCKFFHDILESPKNLEKAHIVHSHGVLEHFSDKEINRILKNQFALKPEWIINYVPSNAYTKPSCGDERLLSISKWYKIFNIRPTYVSISNEGKDLVFIWKR